MFSKYQPIIQYYPIPQQGQAKKVNILASLPRASCRDYTANSRPLSPAWLLWTMLITTALCIRASDAHKIHHYV